MPDPPNSNGPPGDELAATELARIARTATGTALESLLHSRHEAVLDALLENPALREPHLLIMLSRRELPPRVITSIARQTGWMRCNSMKAAVLKHPLTPRHVAVPLLKHIYLFDLLSIALTPGLAADLKRLAEDTILSQLPGVALGQKLTLARRGSPRIAAGMLLATEKQVVEAALGNPAITDQGLAQALASERASPALTEAVLEKNQWMARRPVLLGMMRSKHLTLARFASLLTQLTMPELLDLKQDPRLARNLREYVGKYSSSRRRRPEEAAGKPAESRPARAAEP